MPVYTQLLSNSESIGYKIYVSSLCENTLWKKNIALKINISEPIKFHNTIKFCISIIFVNSTTLEIMFFQNQHLPEDVSETLDLISVD